MSLCTKTGVPCKSLSFRLADQYARANETSGTSDARLGMGRSEGRISSYICTPLTALSNTEAHPGQETITGYVGFVFGATWWVCQRYGAPERRSEEGA